MLDIFWTISNNSFLPLFSNSNSNSTDLSKWSSIDFLFLPVIISISSIPEATASSIIYCNVGLSTIGNISLGCALVAGKNLVPNPAAGITAFLTFFCIVNLLIILFIFIKIFYMYIHFISQ